MTRRSSPRGPARLGQRWETASSERTGALACRGAWHGNVSEAGRRRAPRSLSQKPSGTLQNPNPHAGRRCAMRPRRCTLARRPACAPGVRCCPPWAAATLRNRRSACPRAAGSQGRALDERVPNQKQVRPAVSPKSKGRVWCEVAHRGAWQATRLYNELRREKTGMQQIPAHTEVQRLPHKANYRGRMNSNELRDSLRQATRLNHRGRVQAQWHGVMEWSCSQLQCESMLLGCAERACVHARCSSAEGGHARRWCSAQNAAFSVATASMPSRSHARSTPCCTG